jgi:TniQ
LKTGTESPSIVLAIQTQPFEGESWLGYLTRLNESNCLNGIRDISRLTGRTIRQIVLTDPTKTMRALGISSASAALVDRGADAVSSPSKTPRGAETRSKRGRVCPLCLSSDTVPFVRSYWDHFVRVYCLHHRVLLVDTCSRCGVPINQLRRRVGYCDCGNAFQSESSCVVPEWWSQVERLFEVGTGQSRTFAATGEREADAAVVLLRMIREIDGDVSTRETRQSLRVDHLLTQSDVNHLRFWFERWPDSVRQHAQYASTTGKGQVPPWYRRRFDAWQWGDFREEMARGAEASLGRRYVPGARKKVRSTSTVSRRYKSLTELQRATGLATTTAVRWIREGRIPGVRKARVLLRSGKHRTHYKIPLDQYDRLAREFRTSASVFEAARIAGTCAAVIRRLSYCGVIRPVLYLGSARDFRVFPPEIADFVRRVIERSVPRPDGTLAVMSFADATKVLGKQVPTQTLNFMQALASRRIQCIRLKESAVYLDDLGFIKEDVDQFVRQPRTKRRAR